MSKQFEYYITHNLNNLISKRLKNRSDIVRIILECSSLLINDEIPDNTGNGEFELIVSKMKRLFFFCGIDLNKIFSISFPFEIEEVSGKNILFGTSFKIEITPYILSMLITLTNRGWFEEEFCFDDMYDLTQNLEDVVGQYNIDNKESIIENIIQLLQLLNTFEISYLRYDYDEEQEDGDNHPLHHIDFNYSQTSTFKIGLNERTTKQNFKYLVDNNYKCCYINKLE